MQVSAFQEGKDLIWELGATEPLEESGRRRWERWLTEAILKLRQISTSSAGTFRGFLQGLRGNFSRARLFCQRLLWKVTASHAVIGCVVSHVIYVEIGPLKR